MIVSFVIPAYNVENYISKTLESLLKQTNKNFEIIVVNDGSTDKTLEVINNIFQENQFKNFKIINKENGGVSSARNLGIKVAKGDYIVFLDGDDYVEEILVEKIAIFSKQFNPDIVTWKFLEVDENDLKIEKRYKFNGVTKNSPYNGKEILSKILVEKSFWIWTGSAAYRREFIMQNSLVYTENCSTAEDVEFIFHALLHADKVIFVNEYLSYYVQRKSSITKRLNLRRFDHVKAYERILVSFKQHGFVDYEIYNNLKLMCFRNFIGVLDAFVKYYDYKKLREQIERYYPGLLNMMKLYSKDINISPKNLKLKIKRSLFAFSFFTYYHLTKLWFGVKNIFKFFIRIKK